MKCIYINAKLKEKDLKMENLLPVKVKDLIEIKFIRFLMMT